MLPSHSAIDVETNVVAKELEPCVGLVSHPARTTAGAPDYPKRPHTFKRYVSATAVA